MILGKVMPYFLFCNSRAPISDEVFASAVEENLFMTLFILLTAKQKAKSLGQNRECLIHTQRHRLLSCNTQAITSWSRRDSIHNAKTL